MPPSPVALLDDAFPAHSASFKPDAAKADAAFNEQALRIFRRQAEANPLYLRWLQGLRCRIPEVRHWTQIPALPIACFREHLVHTPPLPGEGSTDPLQPIEAPLLFRSSGSTSQTASRHWMPEPARYREAFLRGFRRAFGLGGMAAPGTVVEGKAVESEWAFLCLLPAYLEREGSSLVYMCNALIRRSAHPESGFFLHEHDAMLERAYQLKERGVPTMLFGAAFALLDLAESGPHDLSGVHIVETGGMKGRRREPVREELHAALCAGLGVDRIGGEYGMTELHSQAWSHEAGRYHCPPWMRICIRDLNDPLAVLPHGRVGAIDVLDLAGTQSCAFVGTADLGRSHPDGSFEVLGRYDHAELRGCNLLVA